MRVKAHRRAWAPARIKQLLGLEVSGDEPASSFALEKYRKHEVDRAVCHAVMNAARGLGASAAVVGTRSRAAYPVPRRLYESIGFTTVARTEELTWR